MRNLVCFHWAKVLNKTEITDFSKEFRSLRRINYV